jgi:prefoldin subunit 5
MNKNSRNMISFIETLIKEIEENMVDIKQGIELVRDEEDEYWENMPESLASSAKGEAANEAIEALDDALAVLQSAEAELAVALELLETARA